MLCLVIVTIFIVGFFVVGSNKGRECSILFVIFVGGECFVAVFE